MLDDLDLNTPTYVRLRERLRQDIISGVWRLGHHVRLSELSEHYGVSGNPIREALLHLEGDGIVQMRMHRGAVIPDVNRRFVENVYDINGAIAVMLAREVVDRIQPRQLSPIEAAAEAFEAAAASGEHIAMVSANRAFHSAINAVADNRPALEILRGRLSLIDALRVSLGYRQGRLDEIITQHRGIVDAIRRRKAREAAVAVLEHVQSAKKDLLARMDELSATASAVEARSAASAIDQTSRPSHSSNETGPNGIRGGRPDRPGALARRGRSSRAP
jgi:DNA-binding GntR family transcriptional regulator